MTDFRLRKAWMVHVDGYDAPEIEFGPNAGKIRRRVQLYFDHDVAFSAIHVRRCQSADVQLPVPDALALSLSIQERDALLHAHGSTCGDVNKAGYRDYFFTRRDDLTLCALETKGLMRAAGQSALAEAGDVYFITTDDGKRVADSLTPEYNP